jgi:MFS family permease
MRTTHDAMNLKSRSRSMSAGMTDEEAERGSASATLLFAARAVRDFGDGFIAILLPVYLLALGLSPLNVGVLSTASLLGSALLTLGIGLIGARHDRRRLLIGASSLMIATGVLFAAIDNFAVLLVVAFAGTINPSAGSVSIFVPLEHAALASAMSDSHRTKVFAHYSLVGALAAAAGALMAGVPPFFANLGVDPLTVIKAMFVFYAVLGLIGGALYARLPARASRGNRSAPSALGSSRSIVLKLAALFSLDAFAGGLVVQSLMALWLFERFNMSLTAAGAFFFWSGVLSAFSFPVATCLARRIGLINTMVFTHIPASLALMLAAISPTLPVALGLLLLRAALSQMDVPARSSYVMAVVTEAERSAAASFTSVPRSLAAAASPALAGAMVSASRFAWPLLICGALKIIYDLLLWRRFRHVKPPEEQ